jgi:hypothetical protein
MVAFPTLLTQSVAVSTAVTLSEKPDASLSPAGTARGLIFEIRNFASAASPQIFLATTAAASPTLPRNVCR